jgi:putative peptide zinc metalloprotease protein
VATTEEPVTRPLVASPAPPPDVPRLATDVELIGRFEDSGFKEPPYIARRSDGQMVQLAPLLYALAEEIDGRRDTAEVAEALSHRIQRGVDADMVDTLLDGQLRRLGLVAQRDGVTAEVQKLDPLLALKFRTKVVPSKVVRALTTIFRPLFWPPVLVAVVTALVALDVWLFGVHGISQGVRHVLYQPALLFLLLGGVVVATAFHEIGHATAVRYGGAEPGVMGVGVYIVWPAFYTDITDAYRLGKWGRLRADTGGMYFNAVFALAMAGAYAATGFEPLLLLIVLQNFAIIQQSLPFLRLDGYYIISDLTGVPDMFSRIRPVLASLVPWRPADDRVAELKPWVRSVVTGYVLLVVPILVLAFALMIAHAPRAFATAWDSLSLRVGRLDGEAPPRVAMDVLQMVALVLPCLGMAYTTARIAGRAGGAAWGWSDGRPLRRGPLLIGAGTALACVAFAWWPQPGAYRPISSTDRGTLTDGVRSLSRVAHRSAPAAAGLVPPTAPAGAKTQEGEYRRGDPGRPGVTTSTGTVTVPARPRRASSLTTAPGRGTDVSPQEENGSTPAPSGSAPTPSDTSASPSDTTTPAETTTTTTTQPSNAAPPPADTTANGPSGSSTTTGPTGAQGPTSADGAG